MIRPPPRSPLFPYTPLSRSGALADRLSGSNAKAVYGGSNTTTSLKVMGVDLVVLGKKEPTDDDDETITYANARRRIYKKVILRGGRLAGAILLGDLSIAPRLLRAFHKKERIREKAAEILFTTRPAQSAEEAEASDRKSTRLNSSHSQISYAVFCLK